MLSVILITICVVLTQVANCRILRDQPNFVSSPSRKHESILYSCFINNAETEIIIHEDIPQHFKNNKHIESLHEGLSLSISTFSCYQYTHLNFTFSLKLFQNLYDKNGGFKIYKDGQLQPKPNSKQYYRSFLGDVAIFEYTDQSSSATHIIPGKAALTFLGNISMFSDENKSEHSILYKCQSFSAQIWTTDFIYEINPIPTLKSSSPTCNTMTLSVIPTNRLHEFSQNLFLNQFMRKHSNNDNNKRQLLEDEYVINRFDCGSWDDQWRHHHSVKIGLVIDKSFYDKFENSDDLLDEYIALIFTNTNGLFEAQLNIHISIGDVLVADNITNYASSSEWWLDTPTGGSKSDECILQSTQFDLMKDWNSAKWTHDETKCTDAGYDYTTLSNCPYIDKHASWMLLSNCWTGAGSATRGKLCKIDRSNVATVNYNMDVTWLVFAHELGHLFGSVHYFAGGTGGIMDYGEQKYEGIHQFRMKEDVCWGVQESRKNEPLDYKPDCWQTYDYGLLNYEWWRQTGNYSKCYPSCGNYQFKIEIIECVTTNDITVDDSNCGLELRPYGKFIQCEDSETTQCEESVCGNGLWEINEECDTELLDDDDISNNCCQSDCKRSPTVKCLRLKKQIDAAFTDSNGKLYLFQGSQYAVYSNIDGDFGSIGSPDIGYPKYILDSFPIAAWNSNFDAAFCTLDNIVYIFKDFSYIRIDLNAINIDTGNAQIDSEPIAIEIESSSFAFGYIPRIFGDCGHIDAAFIHSIRIVTIICDTLSYSWNIGEKSGLFENIYRPFFSDYNIQFGDFYGSYYSVDAASYNISTQILRFYGADVYVDYINGQQYGDENKLQPMGYWVDNANCGKDNCGNCDVVHNNKCYDSSYLVVIQFESIDFDNQHWDSINNIQYDQNGGVFSGSNAVEFNTDSQIILKMHSSLYSTITNWRMTVWLYPTDYNNEQDFFHIVDQDTSHTVLVLNTSANCLSNEELTITVKHTNTIMGEIIIFEDTDCIIPLQLNKWSKLTFDAIPSMIAVTVNSKTQTSNIIESEIDLTIDFKSWHLGMNYVGKMDYFVFQETDGEIIFIQPTVQPTVPPDAAACVFPFVSNIAEMIAWISACLAIYTVGMWALYKYYGAKVLLNHIARQLNIQNQQPFDPNNNDAGAGNNDDVEMMVINQPQQVQEAAAGMAIQAIEQVLSGNVTPNILSPRGKIGHDDDLALSRHLLRDDQDIISPRGIRYSDHDQQNQQNEQQYDGNFLTSPAKKWHK